MPTRVQIPAPILLPRMHRELVPGQQPAVAAVIPSANSAFQNTDAPSMAGIPNSMTSAANSMYAAANSIAGMAAAMNAWQVVYLTRTSRKNGI